ncbi:hypothetical protein PIB30_090975 [Stylosanthes scabra]|uniref:Transposase (putative) gypsy type domain-containing protein n=1 Tax=Stylosanthes scabra TaxID=79078 RepID=A0ABU6ZT26_9FABA|nr:hypothetical protein [Stylosanthes scabra]
MHTHHIAELGDAALFVRDGSGLKLRFLPCTEQDRVYHRGEGWEHFFVYSTLFLDIGVRFPFSEFQCGVLSELKCAPTRIHPNAWAFVRGFEILMEYVGVEPSLEVFFSFFQAKGVRKGGLVTLNSVQERFPLYWYSEPVQILGMSKVSRESLEVIEFLESHVCTKELLSLTMVFKWDKEREYAVRYLETTTGGLKNYFKNKNERGFSASNAVKVEEGVVVNQPPEKKKAVSMKRRRAEEGGSSKKVIDLTSTKCCGKEVSLDQVKCSTERQKPLHGYVGEEDLTSVWSEHFPVSVIAEEHFQSKTDLELLGIEELKANSEAEKKKEESSWEQKKLELERELEAAREQNTLKDKELLELKADHGQLKGKLQKLDKEKTELEARVVELCVQKKEAETSKEDHGYDMLAAGFERARKQAAFLFPDIKFDILDPVKVVHNGALVDDDEVDLEGGDDRNSEEGGA